MAQEKGIMGMLECFQYIRENKDKEGGVKVTTSLYSTSPYYYANLELKVKVQAQNLARYFMCEWKNPNGNEEYPVQINAIEDSSHDLFDLFMSIDEEIGPELNADILWLFDAICEKERKHYVLLQSSDNDFKYISKLEDEKEIEANNDGVLPFDYVSRFNELSDHLCGLTIYPPEEITTIEDMVQRLREMNNEQIEINDIDYNLDATMILVQAEGNKGFSVNINLVPDIEDLDEAEISVAAYYLIAMFTEAVKNKDAFPDVTSLEIRQISRMLLEIQSGSSSEVSSSTTTTTFRPAVYNGVPADSHADASQSSANGGLKKGKKHKAKKDKQKEAFPDYNGHNDLNNASFDPLDDEYMYQ